MNHFSTTRDLSTGNLLSPSGKGKYSDIIINSIKRYRGDEKPSYRFTCAAVTGYFKSSCTFNVSTDTSGDCKSESYSFNTPSYGTAKYSQTYCRALAD